MRAPGRVPPLSPYGLIQETLWPDEWAILVACVMLNCTSRKQVERVLPGFLRRWPDAAALLLAEAADVTGLCRSLGFANRRTANLKRMAAAYAAGEWKHARELPGIGEYGARAHEIFCEGRLGEEPPKDHALVLYHAWARQGLSGDGAGDRQQVPDPVDLDEEGDLGLVVLDPRGDADQLAVGVEGPASRVAEPDRADDLEQVSLRSERSRPHVLVRRPDVGPEVRPPQPVRVADDVQLLAIDQGATDQSGHAVVP